MAATRFSIDPAHSDVSFSVRHMMFAKVRGHFRKFSGNVTLDDANPAASSVEAEIESASIDTGSPDRDKHLRTPDFLDVEKFPKLTFKSSKVEGKGDKLSVTGTLTLHGLSKEVVLDVERTGSGKDPWGNERQGFAAKGSLNRKDFGLAWNQALEAGGVLVGEKIELELEVQALPAK